MAWDSTNTSCSVIYSLLTGSLDQMDQSISFANAGTVTMSQLIFFNALASPDVIRLAATALAEVLDSTLINAYLCSYKSAQTQAQALSGITDILVNGQSTVANLSATVDNFYQFIG
ncbi:hypothetical protein KXQ82_08840 [Mucilaginibacter sp. HMF5004]|uniref:hypothetical protein n=1 Tax=Mucilaginibacter rivuli TaxID=2857527 RepID=UPI001C60072C|nr:hypothetical protein [Mucilaginibacter rivuli]MBW4889820.1 hypothetical protein [Mucilaginibacter rivuli]